MVQILPNNEKRSGLESVLIGLNAAVPGIQEFLGKRESQRSMSAENEAAKRLGIDLSGINDPKMRQEAFKQLMEVRNAPDKFRSQYDAKNKSQLDMLRNLGLGKSFEGNGSKQEFKGNDSNEINVDLPSLIPEEDIIAASLVNPSLANTWQRQNEMMMSEARHNQKMMQQQLERSPEFKREQQLTQEQAKADSKYFNELQSASKQHAIKMQSLNNLERLNKKGVTGKPYEKLLEKFGLVGLTSSGRREFSADVKNLITDIRSILGSQFTGFEFQTILNAYPSADFSKEANESIIKNLQEFEKIRDKEFQIANELKKENGGRVPEGFQEKVNERLQEYAYSRLPEIKSNTYEIMKEEYGIPAENVLMFSPDGEPLNVPSGQVDYYESLGAKMFP